MSSAQISGTMKPKRPTSMTVMGIIGIIWCGLALLGSCWGGFAASIVGSMQRTMYSTPGFDDVFGAMENQFSTLMNTVLPLLIAYLVCSLLISGIGLTGHIGLLANKPWARRLTMSFAAASIAFSVLLVVAFLVIIGPAIKQVTDYIMNTVGEEGWKNAGRFDSFGFSRFYSDMITASVVISVLVNCVIPVLLLVFLNSPRVKKFYSKTIQTGSDA